MPTIRFVTSDCAVDFPEGDDVNLLRVAIRNECDVPYKCASGNCGTDRVRVVDGAENLSPMRKRERERLGDLAEQGYRLCCQTYAIGDVSLVGSRPEGARRPLGRQVAAVQGRRALEAAVAVGGRHGRS